LPSTTSKDIPEWTAYFAAKRGCWNAPHPGCLRRIVRAKNTRRIGTPCRRRPASPRKASRPDARLAGTVFAAYPQRENFPARRRLVAPAGCPGAALRRGAQLPSGSHRLARVVSGAA